MLVKALLIGLIAGFGILDGRAFGECMIGRPIVLSPLVGLVLGDFQSGVIVGGTLELIWMGLFGVGAATPPDVVTGGVLGTAFAIISNKGPEVALALAVPIALLAQSLGILVRFINSWFMHKADQYADKGNITGLKNMHIIAIFLFFASTFIPSFLAMLLGADAIKAFINAVPKVILDGLTAASGLLPALGFALLLQLMVNRRLAPYFVLGFVLAIYLKLNIIAIAIIGVLLAVLIEQNGSNQEKEVTVNE